MSKTLGQIAYETYHAARPSTELWENLTTDQSAEWEEAAAAVYVSAFEKLPDISQASVKVMRSYDYCHFEVQLSTDYGAKTTVRQADELRKEAARLADKAVAQYKVAKRNTELALEDKETRAYLQDRYDTILQKPEDQRTETEKGVVKAFADRAHWKRRRFDYEDEWQEEPAWRDDND